MTGLIDPVSAGDPIEASWGNSVATEMNTRTLKIDGKRSSDNAQVQMTGDLWLRSVNPPTDVSAAHKKYVNDEDDKRLALTGASTMTGRLNINNLADDECIRMRSQQTGTGGSFLDQPYIGFWDHGNTIQYGLLRGRASGVNLTAISGDVTLTSGSGQDIILSANGGKVRAGGPFYGTLGGRLFQSAGDCLHLVGTSSRSYLGFYANGTNVDTNGTRSGFIGYNDIGHLSFNNEINNGSLIYTTDQIHRFDLGTTRAEVARVATDGVHVGKTNSAIATEGVSLLATGALFVTAPGTGTTPIITNRTNSADGAYFIEFRRTATIVGRIEQTSTTGVALVSGSDRRMKTIQGPITDGVERVKAMQPYRVSWVGDPGRGITDAFIADEMQDVVPEAVFGTPNEIDAQGNAIMQGMAYEKLVTVTIAALKDVIARVETLEGAS